MKMKIRMLISLLLVSVLLINCMPMVNTVVAADVIITDAEILKSQIVATYLNKSNALQWGTKVYMSADKTVKPYSVGGVSMMPVEFFVRSLGGNISEVDGVVTATYSSTTATFTNGSTKSTVNGAEKTLNHKAEIGGGGKLYAPITDLCDIFGIYLHEEANGLIFWSKNDVSASLVWNENNLALKKVLEGFLFDDVTGEEIANMIEERYPGNAHPRLVMTQEKFDAIKEELKKGDGACDAVYWQLYEHLTSYLPAYLSSTPPDYRIEDHGRASEINTEYQKVMLTLAMLYNITDDSMIDNRAAIAKKAYEYMYKAVREKDRFLPCLVKSRPEKFPLWKWIKQKWIAWLALWHIRVSLPYVQSIIMRVLMIFLRAQKKRASPRLSSFVTAWKIPTTLARFSAVPNVQAHMASLFRNAVMSGLRPW